MSARSWIFNNGKSVCNKCGYEIIVTQGKEADYRYYCSNLECENHTKIEDLLDTEECSFSVIFPER